MKKKKATFFDFAPIYREIFPVNNEINQGIFNRKEGGI